MDIEDKPPLPRSISHADLDKSQNCRDKIELSLQPNEGGRPNYFNATPGFTLSLPVLEDYPREFRHFCYDRLVNQHLREELETQKVINWCQNTTNFVPLYTTGDGNCLLHAASLGMWGLQDRSYILRQAVYRALLSGKENSFYQRWRSWKNDELRMLGVVYEHHQWENEWNMVVRAASLDKPRGGGSLAYLDQFHIFVLSNVLRRPIILYSPDKLRSAMGNGTMQNMEIHGIYLPLLWEPHNSIKDPLPIVYNNFHYSALTIIDSAREYTDNYLLLPLLDFMGRDIPIRFMLPGESHSNFKREYLNLKEVPPPPHSHYHTRSVPCARLAIPDQPRYMKPLLSGFIDKCLDVFSKQNQARDPPRQPPLSSSSLICSNDGCERPGFPQYLGMCAQCYNPQPSAGSQNNIPASERNVSNFQRNISSSQISQQNAEELRPCRTEGCDFFGKASTNFYCSSCFKEKQPKCTSCGKFYADDELNGLCNACFMEQTKIEAELKQNVPKETDEGRAFRGLPVPQREPDHPPASPFGDNNEKPKCKKCLEYYANEDYDGFCHGCFLEKTRIEAEMRRRKEERGREAIYDHLQHPLGDDSPVNKQNPLCNNCRRFYADKDYNGLCHDCFMDKTRREAERGYQQNFTAPVHNQARQRDTAQPLDDRPCIICDRKSPLMAFNVVCKHHAERFRSVVMGFETAPPYEEEERTAGSNDSIPPPWAMGQPQYDAPLGRDAVKQLCRSVGCSEYPVPEYDGYCEDCYKKNLLAFERNRYKELNRQQKQNSQDHGQRDRGDYGQRDRGDYGQRDRGDYGQGDRGDYGQRDRGDYGQRDSGQRDRGDYGQRDRGDYGQRDSGQRDRGDYGQRDSGQRDRGDYGQRDRGDYGQRDSGQRDRGDYGQRDREDCGQRDRGDYGQRDRGDYGQRDSGQRDREDYGQRDSGQRDRGDYGQRDRGEDHGYHDRGDYGRRGSGYQGQQQDNYHGQRDMGDRGQQDRGIDHKQYNGQYRHVETDPTFQNFNWGEKTYGFTQPQSQRY